MKKLGKAVTAVVAGIGAIKMINQSNNHGQAIARLYKRNNELQEELNKRNSELQEELWKISSEKLDLEHEINMMKLNAEFNKEQMERDEKEINELGSKIFKLEMDNIGLKSAATITARKIGSSKPDFYTDRMEAMEEAVAAE